MQARGYLLSGLLLLSFRGACQAQELWWDRYNGKGHQHDAGRAIVVDDAHAAVYVAGESYNGTTTGVDFQLLKYDLTTGARLWGRRFYGSGNRDDTPAAVGVDALGNVYVAGTSWGGSATGNDSVVVKYNSAGTQQWYRRYDATANGPGEQVADMKVDAAGNVYVTGTTDTGTTGPGPYWHAFFTIKYDTNGTTRWVSTFIAPNSLRNTARAVAVDHDGNVVVAGTTNYGGILGLGDYQVVKYRGTDGLQLWARRYNGGDYCEDHATAIVTDSANDVYVTGASIGRNYHHGFDFLTIKYDAAGNQLWRDRQLGYTDPTHGTSDDYPVGIGLDAAGNVYVGGDSVVQEFDSDGDWAYQENSFLIVKYSPSGVLAWRDLIHQDPPHYNIGGLQDMVVSPAGAVYLTGRGNETYDPVTHAADILTLKVNAAGQTEWMHVFDGDHATAWLDTESGNAIALDQAGNVYVTGYSIFGTSLTYNDEDMVTLKYAP